MSGGLTGSRPPLAFAPTPVTFTGLDLALPHGLWLLSSSFLEMGVPWGPLALVMSSNSISQTNLMSFEGPVSI